MTSTKSFIAIQTKIFTGMYLHFLYLHFPVLAFSAPCQIYLRYGIVTSAKEVMFYQTLFVCLFVCVLAR